MKEKIEKELEILIEQFDGYFKHYNSNAATLSTMMTSKTDAESQERFKKAEFTAVEWEHLTKNNILDNSLKRTCSKILAILDLEKRIGMGLNQELIKKVFIIPGFTDAFENYAEEEVFLIDANGDLQERSAGAFNSHIDKTKEVTKKHYENIRENIKQELEQFK